MRQTFILIIFILNACLLSAQITITREGTTINNTTSGFWEGMNISRSVPAKVSVLNNSITSVNASGYLLQAGDEAPLSTNNNIDGAVITGNKLTWNGTDAASITHGMFIGYNINYTVRYNYLDKTPYGILFKSGTDGGTNMTYSSGYGAAYNIVKNSKLSLRMKGINGVQVYNNTFYSNQRSGSVIFIDANHDRTTPAPSTGAKIKNNIFYTVYQIPNISIESACLSNFESDYNVFFCESGTPVFTVSGSQKTFAQWQAMGYDLHSVVVNPNFNNTSDFVPGSRLNNGTNLGTTWQTGLSTGASWVAGSAPATANQNGTWQVGARIYSEVTAPPPPIPVYSASSVENATPSVVEMTYNLSLANIVPAISAFSVRVNSTARNINSVAVSGTKVLLTLASPVINGDVVTVAYTKPAVNPLQTAAGGQAATITAQAVTNRVNPVIVNPVFVSAAIGNETPSRIDLSYNLSLANIIPAASSFAVRVNSVARSVNSVTISGTVVLLVLASPVIYGDVVTVAYTKPASNPLQTPAGGQAVTITAQSVTNKVSQVIVNPVYVSSSVENATPSVVEMTYNSTLANIVPAVSAFSVRVNSTARNVNSVTVSGTKVLLTLASPVVNGNAVTVAYTKPAVNPLQTAAGGQAATITAQAVTNRVNPVIVNPVFVSAAIGNETPSRIDLSYNLSLANIIPAASSFAVRVNSVARAVNSVTISGTVVLLALASPVIYGDVVTLAYTKPASNPLQTPAGGQAVSITAQSVTNKVSQVIVNPVYVSSSVENATPSVVEMTYNSTLANIVPAVSAFSVMVNSTARNVNSVTISGTKVLLTLASPVVNGNAVTVAYTKPATNPLQTAAGGQAATITAQAVTNRVNPVIVNPVFVSAAIGETTPSRIDLSYNLSLANIIPAASSFAVRVNSVARAVNSVTISGTVVLLTLASPVVYGDVVTVAYTKPASNPLQTSSGGQAATISAQPVTNKIAPPVPVYVSSAIENAAPAIITMTYNLSLAAKVPAASAFSVLVNSVARNISSVSVSGAKVLLTLASPVIYGDVVTVAYTKPSTNPLQTNSGVQAATISAKAVTNGVAKVATPVVNTPPVVVINSPPSTLSGFVAELDATGSFDANKDNLTYNWVVPANIAVSSTIGSKIEFLSPVVNSAQTVEFKLNISDGKVVQSKSVKVEILPYEPDLEVAEVVNIEASDFQSPNYPYNIIDGNIGTMWSANGDNQWLVLELKEPFSVEHVMVSFQPGQKKESYFDVMGSADSVTWEPILTKSASCAFSGDLQVFDFPPSKAGVEFNFVKFVGHKNSVDSWNHISEFKIFGYKHRNPTSYEEQVVKLYPNPAREFVNIRIDDSTLNPDFIRVISLSGRVLFEQKVDPGILELRLPIDLERGVYIVQLGTGDLTLFTQKLVVNI